MMRGAVRTGVVQRWALGRPMAGLTGRLSTRRQPSWPRMLRLTDEARTTVKERHHNPARLARAAAERAQRPVVKASAPAGGSSSAIGTGQGPEAATAAAAAAEGVSVPAKSNRSPLHGDGSADWQGEPQSKQPIAMHTVMQEYLLAHSKEPQVLAELREVTRREVPVGFRMLVPPEQGAFMGWLVAALGVRRILELGVFTGHCLTMGSWWHATETLAQWPLHGSFGTRLASPTRLRRNWDRPLMSCKSWWTGHRRAPSIWHS
mmetsp:Transcript_4540/g.13055  ORF Transcript_4540/g.13055 Transcript_4540/m.13055 type:complete len:262 (-) Transcript_4540:537-1322(-)